MLVLLLLQVNKLVRDVSEAVFGNYFQASKEVVLVTGGSGGLGHELVKTFAAKNPKAIISADIKLPPENERIEGVQYMECDVSEIGQVLELQQRISAEIGDVSILVNNAAITIGKNLVDLQIEEIENIIGINLLSNFYTIKAFLPAMLSQKRGYIITVGSVLGYMSPAKLSAYGASKSGLVALHESLTYEMGPPSLNRTGIKTLLLCPGQLQTTMFASVTSPSSFLAPELDPHYVADHLIRALELGRRGEIKLPFYGNFIPLFRAVPWPIVELVREISGIDKSMQTFKNTAKQLTKKASSLISLRGSIIPYASSPSLDSSLESQHHQPSSLSSTLVNSTPAFAAPSCPHNSQPNIDQATT